MKKELCAALALILLIAAAAGNLLHLNNLMEQITEHIDYSLLYCSLEDYAAAHTETSKAYQVWKNAETHTKIMLQQNEIDSVNDIFFDIWTALQNREKHEGENLLRKLQSRTDSILSTEGITLGSVF